MEGRRWRSAGRIFGVGALCAIASGGVAATRGFAAWPGQALRPCRTRGSPLLARGPPALAAGRPSSPGFRGLAAQRAAAFGDLFANQPTEAHDASVIWLHGLGDTGRGWAGVMPQLAPQFPTTRFFFPTAATQPVTVNGGMSMPSWFDINSLEPSLFKLDPPGLQDSVDYVLDLVQGQIEEGIKPERIVLVGFSQGGAVVAASALSATEQVGGVLMLSTFLASTLPDSKLRPVPIHFFHGEADQVVPMDWGQRSRAALEAAGLSCTWRTYPNMQHGSCEAELDDVAETLAAILGKGR